MYIIVMVMVQIGQHKIVSDQVLYPSMEKCEEARSILVKKLENSKPLKDSFLFSKCTKISFEKDKTKVTL